MERTERVGLNEAVVREVNERLRELGDRFGLDDEDLDLVCECGTDTCTERIAMKRSDYEALRADPSQFAIVPGHEQPDLEEVVARHGRYEVMRKRPGMPQEIAEATNPRT